MRTRTSLLAAIALVGFYAFLSGCGGVQCSDVEVLPIELNDDRARVVAAYGEQPRVNTGLIQDRELSLTGTLMYKHEDFVRAAELMESGQVVTAPLETAHFPLERYVDAYAFIDRSHEQSMKVFIDVA